jgi:Tol biopolymer transport system component
MIKTSLAIACLASCQFYAAAQVRKAGPGGRPASRSLVSIYDLASKSVEVIFTADTVWEAPNWSRDGQFLMVNSGGNLYRLPARKGAQPEKIDLGSIAGCNNDHGISPDGKQIAISARGNAGGSQVYLANADGSNPRLMTPQAPSYYHGWSPDGKWLAYTAQRDKNFDIYRLPAAGGGVEERLTTNPGLDDGPDYSPDGKWIYVNSDRTGNFDIWRFPAGGAGENDKNAQQVTSDEWEDWFPHPSPDGKWMVFVSFEKGTQGHPANRNVALRMMPLPGAKLTTPKIEILTRLFGGQGTINVNSWSPDSKRFAFVSYELMK